MDDLIDEPHDPAAMPPGVEPRAYQTRIVRRAVDLYRGTAVDRQGRPERAVTSVLIESPTGSGKTVMGLAVAAWAQRTMGHSVGWAAMRRNLLAQAQAENDAKGFGVRLTPISMFDKAPPRVDLLVVDEAQHDGAMSMSTLHGAIRPKLILGLSATPYRADRVKLCFEAVLRDAGIHSLIQDGFLSPFRHFTIPHYTPEAVAGHYAREPGRWGQTLIFFLTLAECRACVAALRAGGVGADLVTASTDRERQLDDFAAGRTRVLVNMLILTEGFDCPSLQTVFCRPSGRGPTVQMAGRVLRRHPSLAFKQIVQCARTRHPFARTATPAEQYLWSAENDEWRSLTPNATLDAMCHRMQSLIAASPPAELPPFLTKLPVWMRAGDGRGHRERAYEFDG